MTEYLEDGVSIHKAESKVSGLQVVKSLPHVPVGREDDRLKPLRNIWHLPGKKRLFSRNASKLNVQGCLIDGSHTRVCKAQALRMIAGRPALHGLVKEMTSGKPSVLAQLCSMPFENPRSNYKAIQSAAHT